MKRALLFAGLLVGLTAVPAYGHVTVSAPGATRGGSDQLITFRVPVEKDKATVGLTVQLPTATPIASVDVLPMAGWRHAEVTTKLATPVKTDDGEITSAVTRITWTATAGGLAPGEFGEFTLLAGQLPDAATLTFGAVQTYSDGSVVRWIQSAAPGSTAEPDHPAPTLTLAAAGSTAGSAAGSAAAAPAPKAHSSSAANALSIVALAVAAAALGLAVVNRARRA
jgi:uncharacterized protein